MTRIAAGRAVQRARQWLVRRARGGDGGFILIESIIAIAVITVVMGAVGAEFVSGMISTSQQRAQQTAVQLADSTMEQIRALHPSDLVTGRDSASVTTQFNAAPTAVQPWLAQMDKAVDSNATAGSGPTAAIPTKGQTQKPGTITYTINEYLGWCSIRTSASATTDCVAPSTLGAVSATPYLRAVVSATWVGTRCGSSSCTYVTSTLISTVSDRTFRINTAPYTAPVVVAPGNQSNAVNDTVSLQLTVQNGTGVPPFTWAVTAGSLPTGLGLSPTGLISGTVGGSAGTYNFTVQVTDAFLRTDTQAVTWTIKPALQLTDPGDQASTTTGGSVNLALAATGGEGGPYTFTDPTSTLPPGLSMTSAGVITGRPSTVGTYTVQIKVGDGKRFTTGSFTWTVTTPPLAASNPGPQKSTVSTAISPLTLSASGGSGTYTWSDSPRTLPAGLSLSAGGVITGTPTATGTSAVTLTVNDGTNTKTVAFSWTVYARPAVTAPGNQASSVGASINLQLTTSCPNSACVYTFGAIAPSGLAISSTGLISGTVGTTVKTFAGITIVVTDAATATATSTSFSWTVNAAPAMGSPGNQTTMRGGTVNLDISGLDSGGTGPYTFGQSGLPAWLTLNPGTGKITGTAPAGANSTTSGISVSVTDGSGVIASSTTFKWNVTNLANSFTNRTTSDATAVNLDLDTFTTGGTSPFTYTTSALPAGLTLNASTGVISGTTQNLTNASVKTGGITITVTDSAGATITTSPFAWYVTDMKWTLPSPVNTAQGTNMSGYTAASYVTGGGAGKVYSVTGLPTGLSMSSTGAVTGSTNTKGTWTPTFTVVDSVGATESTTVTWTVS